MPLRFFSIAVFLLASLIAPHLDASGKPKEKPKYTNRLAKATSPYLLMHSHNPTDWYPWGPEAFAKAQGAAR